ncbi:OmpA family protein [Lutibacter sp.]|uniref:OmpA family protein n=1 Tax=Lutibacter sp. TaxID=1925666 RepID=UPI0035620280
MKKILVTLIILLFSTQLLLAQNLRRANNLFEKRAYVEAAELYLNEEVKTQEVHEKLADCYYFNSKMDEAAKWYNITLKMYNESVDPIYFYRYSQALKGINNFEEADKWLVKYQQKKQLNSSNNIGTLTFFETLNKEIKRPYILHPVSINSMGSDFGVSVLGNKIIFASTRNEGQLYEWNNQPYLDLFEGDIDNLGTISNVIPFSEKINTKMHESNAVFTADGKTMYFTRNNFIEGKKGKDEKKITHLKIYKAQLIDNEWSNIIELPFNSNNYSTEHPALSPDEKKLYFASDMPGSYGSFDLYEVDINSNGTFGIPKNLGPTINTEQREQFPFVSSKNILYFASDGHLGMGGLDIFKSEISNAGFSKPINLSSVINSPSDDFSFIINEENETGYFSSNRAGGIGDDDIYRFTQVKQYFVQGLVQNKNNLELLTGSLVTLFDDKNNVIDDMIVGNDAAYSFEIENNKNYKIRGTRKFYNPYEVSFSTDNKGEVDKNILLLLESYDDAEKAIVTENEKIQIKINPIYFDFNKWNIRSDAALELENVVVILKKYPEMVIEIGAHTDCRGSENYNLSLSHKRAKSVREYLVSQGVNNDNVKSVGYGEMQPLNKCIKSGICKEDEYDINRRCEFVIIN